MDIQCIVEDVFSEYNVSVHTEQEIQNDIVNEIKKELRSYLNELMCDFDGQDAYGIIETIKEKIC